MIKTIPENLEKKVGMPIKLILEEDFWVYPISKIIEYRITNGIGYANKSEDIFSLEELRSYLKIMELQDALKFNEQFF